ncbi:hypothetical protein JHK86_012454 [Glycine max]|nr:hypothetical protein JHK86_012454 [Glycine max]
MAKRTSEMARGTMTKEKGDPHNCLDDAKATMDLVLAMIKHGVDREFSIALVQEHTPSKTTLQMDEAVGVSKKAKVDPKIEEDASSGFGKCDTNAHSNEIEALDERLKQSELEIELLRQQLIK